MITPKQRSYLKGLANTLDPTVYIGKSGATEATIKEISDYLNAHEIVKVKILESCDLDPKYAANEIASMIGADFVQAIGRKFVLYRFSSDNHQIELPLR